MSQVRPDSERPFERVWRSVLRWRHRTSQAGRHQSQVAPGQRLRSASAAKTALGPPRSSNGAGSDLRAYAPPSLVPSRPREAIETEAFARPTPRSLRRHFPNVFCVGPTFFGI